MAATHQHSRQMTCISHCSGTQPAHSYCSPSSTVNTKYRAQQLAAVWVTREAWAARVTYSNGASPVGDQHVVDILVNAFQNSSGRELGAELVNVYERLVRLLIQSCRSRLRLDVQIRVLDLHLVSQRYR